MTTGTVGFRPNLEAIESLYLSWRSDPNSVDSTWRVFFEGFEIGLQQSQSGQIPSEQIESKTYHGLAEKLINAYRSMGHLKADLDPLGIQTQSHCVLGAALTSQSNENLDKTYEITGFVPGPSGTIKELIVTLENIYCKSIGVEISHLHDGEARDWLISQIEQNRGASSSAEKKLILEQLLKADLFEKFLHQKFVGQKRFSLEGGDALVPFMEKVVDLYADLDGSQMVVGMAHRGRLNVLANVLQKPCSEIFAEFEENYKGGNIDGDGDVKYHLGYSVDRVNSNGRMVHLSLTPNPSHLEFVNPVVEGRVRAKQDRVNDEERKKCLPFLIHGDAAFAGQGIVPETLSLAGLEGYTTGGTIHVIINNQVGFTTKPSDSRSSLYCTDVAKIILAPIFHVNGDDPEAVVWLAKLSVEYRQRFGRDVVVDLVCFRRHGHNEGDEPSFTQPLMYQNIRARLSPAMKYGQKLVGEGVLAQAEVDQMISAFEARLQSSLDSMRNCPVTYQRMSSFQDAWKNLTSNYSHAFVKTAIPSEKVEDILRKLFQVPEGFQAHPKIVALNRTRLQAVSEKKPVDWPTAELLAFGSLVTEGHKVRLSGQDCRRGTFSQRHSVIYDMSHGKSFTPLNALASNQAEYEVYDSMLSEAAVLGFEYGYSLDTPSALVLWEAQFGDFGNGAQVLIDQFICSSESKWRRESGLVMLLPHGYEGQGPEHSSARLERFLQLCAENNLQVVYPTTPSQYFHLLRRQLHREFRKPLVVMTPKSLLRHKLAVSPVEDFSTGGFLEVLDDQHVDPTRVKRVILCSGKVYYDLWEQRSKLESYSTALIRLEQIYPFPESQLKKVLDKYSAATDFVWVQEESHNMGAWFFVEPRVRALGCILEYVGRDESASPAVGSKKIHESEQKQIVEAAFEKVLPFFAKAKGVFASKDPSAGISPASSKATLNH
jgi:2-oxoglutarate dehydrogenase E1 component